jgi:hypothetical protein
MLIIMKEVFDHRIHEFHRIEHVFDKVIPLILHHQYRSDQLKFKDKNFIFHHSSMISLYALYKQSILINFK